MIVDVGVVVVCLKNYCYGVLVDDVFDVFFEVDVVWVCGLVGYWDCVFVGCI